jgi:flagellar hook-associated protein 2
VKTNKESPLYKISNIENAKRYAIDIKENAKSIQNVVASLSDNYGNFSDSFQKKVAISSDEDTVEVEYIGDGNEKNDVHAFDIKINRLATPQINTGNFLKGSALSFIPGMYSFDLATNASTYEFQYNVNAGDTNQDVMNKLANLITGSNLGVTAEVLEKTDGTNALSLTSHQTGLRSDEDYLFTISPGTDPASIAAMDLLGINEITTPSQNSDFTLNGIPQSSLSNTFTINNTFSLNLKQASPDGQPATISFKANIDAVADNIQSLVDAYNGILKIAEQNSNDHSRQGQRLLRDMSSASKSHKPDLESIGLMVQDNGSITIDRSVLADAITPERSEDTFDILTKFKDSVRAKADNASINPMFYVDKVIVEYKNPGRNFAMPYISSIYSGMMLDSYA